jgi:hypothetical protein
MRVLIVLSCALALAGCGVLDDVGPATQATPDPAVYGPPRATSNESPASSELPVPPQIAPSAEVASELDEGAVGIVDLDGVVDVRPSSLETASDLTVSELSWSVWGGSGATGEGRMRVPNCQPTCAAGGSTEVTARVELSGPKTCDGRRYFDHAEVRIAPPVSGMQPASYLRAPC